MRGVCLVLSAVALAFGAHAAEGPKIAPPAAWVKPADASKLAAEAGPVTTAATRVLLLDQQFHFGPSGGEMYVESALRADTAQGLAGLGAVALPWQPDTQSLTVHKLHLIRGAQVIDVLADHSFTMLRRETNLEAATLDGVLTAALQIEGVQVGDILDLAFTYGYEDPVLKGHANFILQAPNEAPVDLVHFGAAWAKPRQIRFKFGDGLPAPKLARAGDQTELSFNIRNLAPEAAPKSAPARFASARQIEFSDFTSWAEVSSLFAPLYDQAAVLAPNSPLKAEAARIRAASSDPAVQAAAALALVQDKVRYVFLGMNDGGLAPAAADLTWSRRFGDCKGKTVLLLALLRELGLDARPALVSTTLGDGLEARLPSVGVFDHVLIRAEIAGKVYWLDGTRVGDDDLAFVRIPPYRWALPLQAQDATLVPLVQAPLAVPDFEASLRIDASKGVTQPAPSHGEVIMRGDVGTGLRLQIANAQPADVERILRDFWTKRHDFIEVKSVSATYDKARHEERWIMDGVATMAWDKPAGGGAPRYEADGARLGWKPDFKRDPGPHADAPFNVEFPLAEAYHETILLPNHGKGFTVEGDAIDQKVAATAFWRTARIDGEVFTMEAGFRTLAPEFPAGEAIAAAQALKTMSDEGLFVREPNNYEPTADETKAVLAGQPKTAQDFTYRAWLLIRRGQWKQAIADLDRAIALDPAYSLAFADRAIAHYKNQDFDAARADADKAETLAPGEPVAPQVQGWLAEREGRFADAVADFSRGLDKAPSDPSYLRDRAGAYFDLDQSDKALADLDAWLRVAPKDATVRVLRAELFRWLGQPDRAKAELDAAVAAWPYDVNVLGEHARELALEGHRDGAIRDLDVIIAVKPRVQALLTRAEYRDRSDFVGRLADVDAALKLDPKATRALAMRARIALDAGDPQAGLKMLSDALAASPDSADLHLARAEILARTQQIHLAEADYAWQRAKAEKNAWMLNELCWSEAAFDPLLPAALADCDAALRLLPLAGQIIDSRALVLLRLGRLREAQAEYDKALALRPHEAASLYGRGLAELRLGLAKQGQADLAAAERLDAHTGAYLADNGAKP